MIEPPTPVTGRNIDEIIDDALAQMRRMTLDTAIEICQHVASMPDGSAMRCVTALHILKDKIEPR